VDAYALPISCSTFFPLLSELQVIRIIFEFCQLPLELRNFIIPQGYGKDKDGNSLPKMTDDGQLLIIYFKSWENERYCYPYFVVAVHYDLWENVYCMEFYSYADDCKSHCIKRNHSHISRVIDWLKLWTNL
jgi:hypothetical protein